MGKTRRKHVARETPAAGDERLAGLKELYPEAFSEDTVDFENLRAALGDIAEDQHERYSFTWAGKREAIRILQMPCRATLKPAIAESVDFDKTGNIFIEGDNLETLKLLFKPYFGRVKTIYIDPPYNTGKDFIYPDNYADPLDTYLKLTGQKDADGNVLTSNPESNGRYHSAWLSMMYPRLFLARQLLCEDGVIFISIDDHEVHNLRIVMSEIFGEENFVGQVIWQTATDNNATQIATEYEYVICYARDLSCHKDWEIPSTKGVYIQEKYQELKGKCGNDLETIQDELTKWIRAKKKNGDADLTGVEHYCYVDEKGVYYPGNSANTRPGGYTFDIIHPLTGKVCAKPENGYRWPERTFLDAVKNGDVEWGETHSNVPKIKKRLETASELLKSSYYEDNRRSTRNMTFLMGAKVFDNPKSPRLLKHLMKFTADRESLVVDFFAGSCTTAQAVLELNREDGGNRKFIMVQLPEPTPEDSAARKAGYTTIAEIGKERIRRMIARMKKESGEKLPLKDRETPEDLGFRVYKLAESNYKQWKGVENKDPEAYVKEMGLFLDPLLPGWKPNDVLWEATVKEGFGLGSRLEKEKDVNGLTVWRITDPDKGRSFRVCLDGKVKLSTLKKLGLKKNDLFICRDIALDDETAANLALQCRLKTI